MTRNLRQQKILDLIAKEAIGTQEELAARLNAEGFAVTQATVSRDIKELRLVKTMDSTEDTIQRWNDLAARYRKRRPKTPQ